CWPAIRDGYLILLQAFEALGWRKREHVSRGESQIDPKFQRGAGLRPCGRVLEKQAHSILHSFA
ncbi:MAG: hypothetical protein ABI186_08275, partial [Candidatus Elarobacter sp.]